MCKSAQKIISLPNNNNNKNKKNINKKRYLKINKKKKIFRFSEHADLEVIDMEY